jgi:hypothetical protein
VLYGLLFRAASETLLQIAARFLLRREGITLSFEAGKLSLDCLDLGEPSGDPCLVPCTCANPPLRNTASMRVDLRRRTTAINFEAFPICINSCRFNHQANKPPSAPITWPVT